MATNNIQLLFQVYERLTASDIQAVVFGGWAEELLRISPPRAHGDIDLLCFEQDFAKVDAFIRQSTDISEIPAKHLSHKRAFVIGNTAVELLLVRMEAGGRCITACYDYELTWPGSSTVNVSIPNLGSLSVACPAILFFYRKCYPAVADARRRYLNTKYDAHSSAA